MKEALLLQALHRDAEIEEMQFLILQKCLLLDRESMDAKTDLNKTLQHYNILRHPRIPDKDYDKKAAHNFDSIKHKRFQLGRSRNNI